MTRAAAASAPDAGNIAGPSKTAGEENFPVASLLLPAATRGTVMAYYHFARHADDVADAPDLTPEQKVAALDALDAALAGQETSPAVALAVAYRAEVKADPVLIDHASQLLVAFRRDAIRDYCADWADLVEYCRYSAAPVGRFLLDLHGESHETFPASDALCGALQVLNHLQDCAKDFRELKRVYLPRNWLAEAGLTNAVLTEPASPPALRRVLDQTLDATDELVKAAQALPGLVRNSRLRAQSAITVEVALRLARKLRHGDPLAERVKLGGLDYAAAFALGAYRGLLG